MLIQNYLLVEVVSAVVFLKNPPSTAVSNVDCDLLRSNYFYFLFKNCVLGACFSRSSPTVSFNDFS